MCAIIESLILQITELRFIHREISLLRDENNHQNMEIALLKERVGSTEDFDDPAIIADSRLPDDNHRNKRPARLLPPHILYGERKNETEQQKQNNRRRYEQPTNCSDLSLLGYTLNGFYMIKSNESSIQSNSINNDIKLETVYCAFKQPEGKFNSTLVGKRIMSCRETTKPYSKMIFRATRKVNLKANPGRRFRIQFESALVNSGDAFDPVTGTFIVPQSGVYLFIFRGNVTFLGEEDYREFQILILGKSTYYTDNTMTTKALGDYTVRRKDISVNVQFDKMLKVNRGDKIHLEAQFYEMGASFSGNSTSFTGYLIDSLIDE